MSQLLINQNLQKRAKVELRIDQKFQIIEYHQKHLTFKQTELIKHLVNFLESTYQQQQ